MKNRKEVNIIDDWLTKYGDPEIAGQVEKKMEEINSKYKKNNMKTHHLKTWPEYFYEVQIGSKTFELRKNDRDYKVGDILELLESDPKKEEFTGYSCRRYVSYILEGGQFGLEEGYVIMGLSVHY